MADHLLHMLVTFPLDHPEKYTIEGNIKKERLEDVLSEFIMAQIGGGADDSPAEEHEVYKIHIQLDLSDDSFTTRHNCGNKGLRDGILMDVLKRLAAKRKKSNG